MTQELLRDENVKNLKQKDDMKIMKEILSKEIK